MFKGPRRCVHPGSGVCAATACQGLIATTSSHAKTKDLMLTHKFKIGELVRLKQTPATSAPRGPYEIVRLLPPDSDVPLYRIKHKAENHERVAKEIELSRHA